MWKKKRTVIHYVPTHSICHEQLEDLSFASRSMSLVHETNSKMTIGPSSIAFCHPTNLCYSPPRFLDCQSTLPKKCRQIYPPPPRNGYLRATPPCHHYAQEVWRLLEYIIVKMGWYFNVRKTGTQLPKAPSNLPSAAGKRLLWGNTPVPALCTRASQLLTLDCTINSIEIGWYLMSEDHAQDFLHIYSILLIDVMYVAFTLQPPTKDAYITTRLKATSALLLEHII